VQILKGVDWIHLAEDGLVLGSCEHGSEPLGTIKGGKFLSEGGLCSMELVS
jgi:hypothetical protein